MKPTIIQHDTARMFFLAFLKQTQAKTLDEYRYCKLLVDSMCEECVSGQSQVGKLHWQLFTA